MNGQDIRDRVRKEIEKRYPPEVRGPNEAIIVLCDELPDIIREIIKEELPQVDPEEYQEPDVEIQLSHPLSQRLHVSVDGSADNKDKRLKSYICCVAEKKNPIIEEVGARTNNEAEYMAIIYALKHCAPQAGAMTIWSDSELVVKQINGEYECKKKELRYLLDMVKKEIDGKAVDVHVAWHCREESPAGKHLEKNLKRLRKTNG